MTMKYQGYNNNKYREYGTAVADYEAKCALAEKLGDVKLRQWCVEHASVNVSDANKLDFTKVDALFKYIKEGEQDDV